MKRPGRNGSAGRLPGRLPSLGFLFLALAAACSGGERGTTGPSDGGSGPGEPPSTEFAVHVKVAEPDAGLAARLGWEAGVPGATVQLLRNGTRKWETATTDASGRVVFENVLGGLYRLWAERYLEGAEAEAAGEPRRAFADGRTLEIGGGSREAELALLADRPGDVVISEVGPGTPPPWELESEVGKQGLYFELYNNSSETVFLDGMVYGLGDFFGFFDGFSSCAFSEPVRTDSTGMIVRWALAFPGSGSEYPLGPGETALVAMVAADHRDLHPEMPDLSGADFEISGPNLADNPAVPNMLDAGLESVRAQINWTKLLGASDPYFIADPVDLRSLPIAWRDKRGRGYVKVDAALIHDAMAVSNIWPDQNLEFPPCAPAVHPRFDRYEVLKPIGFDVDPLESARSTVKRKVLRMEDGRQILQNANTSISDFEVGPPKTPGEPGG